MCQKKNIKYIACYALCRAWFLLGLGAASTLPHRDSEEPARGAFAKCDLASHIPEYQPGSIENFVCGHDALIHAAAYFCFVMAGLTIYTPVVMDARRKPNSERFTREDVKKLESELHQRLWLMLFMQGLTDAVTVVGYLAIKPCAMFGNPFDPYEWYQNNSTDRELASYPPMVRVGCLAVQTNLLLVGLSCIVYMVILWRIRPQPVFLGSDITPRGTSAVGIRRREVAEGGRASCLSRLGCCARRKEALSDSRRDGVLLTHMGGPAGGGGVRLDA